MYEKKKANSECLLSNFVIDLDKKYPWLTIKGFKLNFEIPKSTDESDSIPKGLRSYIPVILSSIIGLFSALLIAWIFYILLTEPLEGIVSSLSYSSDSMKPEDFAITYTVFLLGILSAIFYGSISNLYGNLVLREHDINENDLTDFCSIKKEIGNKKLFLKEIKFNWDFESLFTYLSRRTRRNISYFLLLFLLSAFIFIIMYFVTLSRMDVTENPTSTIMASLIVDFLFISPFVIFLWFKIIRPTIQLKILKRELICNLKSNYTIIVANLIRACNVENNENILILKSKKEVIKEYMDNIEGLDTIKIPRIQGILTLVTILTTILMQLT